MNLGVGLGGLTGGLIANADSPASLRRPASAFTGEKTDEIATVRIPFAAKSAAIRFSSSGSTAEIQLGDSPQGPFRAVTPARALTPRTSFSVPRRTGRYVVVWITGMPQDSAAEVSEVRVRART